MAQKKRSKRGGRKLEFTIYIASVLLVFLLIWGSIKGVRGLIRLVSGDDPSSTPSQSEVVSTLSSSTEGENAQTNSQTASSQESNSVASSAGNSAVSAPSTASKPVNRTDYVTYTKTGVDELSEWYLFLVNPENTIGSDWVAKMTYIDSEYQLDSRIITAYKDMVSAAAADGVTLYPISCYRPYSTQQRLYNNRVDRAKREYPSFTQKQAEDYAATHVARPGTSEHQTGLAIDFNSVETTFGSTSAGKWLKAHANEYGFILRYEENKQTITGVTWEPWHYRFVGVKHAKRMTELGYCLEEYVDYIKAGNQ